MKVISHGIVNGIIEDRFGKHGEQHNENGVPSYSLPLEILEAPEGTKSFALFLEDKDACPISGGFSWIHWVAANITRTKLEENDSQANADFVQGLNSWVSIQGGQQHPELSACYGGMALFHRALLEIPLHPRKKPVLPSGTHSGLSGRNRQQIALPL